METHERIEALTEAQALIDEAIALIKDALKGTDMEAHSKSYVIPALAKAAHSETQWLGRDANLDEYIEQLEVEAEDKLRNDVEFGVGTGIYDPKSW